MESFHARLETPIGELRGDRAPAGAAIPSPFRVVGISLIAIGVLLLVIVPWVGDTLPCVLDASLGALLILAGVLMARAGGGRTRLDRGGSAGGESIS